MSGKASTRVFGINELLEQILLELSDALPSHVTATSGHTVPQPAYQLFVLQRTNIAFRDSIRRSKVMQHRMFLEFPASPEPTSDAQIESDESGQDLSQHSEVSYYGPLHWMVDWMNLHQDNWGVSENGEVQYEVLELRKMYRMHPVYLPKALKTEFQQRFARAESSWRHIPVATIVHPWDLMVKYLFTAGEGPDCLWRAFKPAPNAILGDVYDELVDSLEWSDEKCFEERRRFHKELSTEDLFQRL